jgi:hypothetical protein
VNALSQVKARLGIKPEPAQADEETLPPSRYVRVTGSLSRRMLVIATLWIVVLLAGGGLALDGVLTSAVTRTFDDRLAFVLRSLTESAVMDRNGEVMLTRQLADQRYLEPGSGAYWQISGAGHPDFASMSLWDERLKVSPPYPDLKVHFRESNELRGESLSIAERDYLVPPSKVRWRIQVAESRDVLDAEIAALRRTIVRSFALLGAGLIALAAFQAWYGLLPLKQVRKALARMRAGQASRVEGAMPAEVAPMVEELNALVEHNDRQAEEARRHAGNLAHALKTQRDHERRRRGAGRFARGGDPRGTHDAPTGRSSSRARTRRGAARERA